MCAFVAALTRGRVIRTISWNNLNYPKHHVCKKHSLNPIRRGIAVTDPSQVSPPAGWYPDPAGTPQQRWWDGHQWTDTLQPLVPQPVSAPITVPVSEPVAQPISAPIAAPVPVPVAVPISSPGADQPAAFPFPSLTASQPIPTVGSTPRRPGSPDPETDAPASRSGGRLYLLALMTIGIVTAVGGLALFTLRKFATTDMALALQNQLYGAILAGFGAFAMLLWLAAGAIRHR